LVDHHHLDGVMFRHVVAHPDALRASFAPVHRNEGGLPDFIVLNRICLGTELGAQRATGGATDSRIDIRDKIHGYSLNVGSGYFRPD
jgi:hypothetical protein